jgi:tight adherence protein B
MMASAALLALGLMLLYRGWRKNLAERVVARLRDGRPGMVAGRRSAGRLRQLLARVGLTLSERGLYGLSMGVLVVLALVYLLIGPLALPAALLVIGIVVYLTLQWRYRRRLQKMISQLPGLLEHATRSLKSGRTLADAMLLAMARSQEPLREALTGTRRSVELGVSLADAVAEFARLYDSAEFRILAIGIGVNQRYGGNASELLDNLVRLIRDRERAASQLRALTGETRISALVLAVLPVGLAGYILFSNPEFFLGLWHDAAGRTLLYSALALQLAGCCLLWRMLKSI